MGRRNLLVAVLSAAALGVGWWTWHWLSTPRPPEIPLEGVDPLMAEAVRKGVEAVRRQPRSAEVWGDLGMLLTVHAFFKPAETCLTQASRLEPSNSTWPYLQALMLQTAGETRRAAAALRQALALAVDPGERAVIQFRLAMVLIEEGLIEEAIPHVRAIEATEKEGPRVAYLRGLLALAANDRVEATRWLGGLVDVPFCRKRVHTLLATIAPDAKTAQALADAGNAMPPDQPWPDPLEQRMYGLRVDRTQRLEKFNALKEQGRRREAIEQLRPLADRAPDREICFTLGIELYDLADFEEAEQSFRTALRLEPTNVKTHFFIGSCLLLRGEKLLANPGNKETAAELFRQAVAAEDEAIKLHPGYGLAHLTRGLALKHLGRTKEALAALRQAVLIHPDFSNTQLALGEALAEQGEWKEALAHLEYAAQFARPGDAAPAEALKKWRAKAPTGG